MRSNVIMLTAGLAGSSLVTGLLAQRGKYWLGDETFKKQDYDTFENMELVQLNERMFDDVGFDGDYMHRFQGWPIELITRASAQMDSTPYRAFIEKCERHAPWIWKDPRLWLTIRAWIEWLPMENTRLLLVTRDPWQNWVSVTLRRQIQTFEHSRWYNQRIEDTLRDFLRVYGLDALEIRYDELVRHPEREIERINAFLDLDLTVDDLRAVYRGQLYRLPKSWRDYLRAMLIYAKNYRHRLRL
jgi:hypothetical protein